MPSGPRLVSAILRGARCRVPRNYAEGSGLRVWSLGFRCLGGLGFRFWGV